MAVTAIIYTIFGTIAYLVIINLIKQFDVFYGIVNWIKRNRISGSYVYFSCIFFVPHIIFTFQSTMPEFRWHDHSRFREIIYKKYCRISNIALTGFIFSLSIEIVQMFGRGSTDINDMITNTVEASLRYFIYKLFVKFMKEEIHEKFRQDNF